MPVRKPASTKRCRDECRAGREAENEADKRLSLKFADKWLTLADEVERPKDDNHGCNSITRVRT
jgi:hypothetical protein